jgi:hypothetical protein
MHELQSTPVPRQASHGQQNVISLLQNWCRGLDVDEHRALLVTRIPEDLKSVDIEAILQLALLPLG